MPLAMLVWPPTCKKRLLRPAELSLILLETGNTKPETLYKFLQEILHGQGLEFLVAPYAASAQVRWPWPPSISNWLFKKAHYQNSWHI